MTLLLKEAEAAGRNLEWRLARGNTAIRALKWLTQDDLLEHAQLRLASQWDRPSQVSATRTRSITSITNWRR